MKIGYIMILIASLLSRMNNPQQPILFIGQPCACMAAVEAEQCEVGAELLQLLAEREYRWVVVFEPVENQQSLAGYLLRTQPQAEIILMENQELAAKYRLNYAPDCCAVLEIIKKDEGLRWRNGA